MGFEFWVLGFGFWVLGFGFWVLDLGFWVLGFGFWVLGFGFWVWRIPEASAGLGRPLTALKRLEAPEALEGPLEAPGGPWRPLEAPGGPWKPLEAPGAAGLTKYYQFKKTVIKLVLHFQFKPTNRVKAVKSLADARKRRVNV